MSGYLEENRNKLVSLLANIQTSDCPEGWEHVGCIAISGFIGFGFSKKKVTWRLLSQLQEDRLLTVTRQKK